MGKSFNWSTLCLLFILIASLLAASGYTSYKREYLDNPLAKDSLKSFDAGYIYNFYIASKPDINERVFYGYPNASTTIIAFLDFGSASSKYFMEEIFPKIEEEFIKTGKARFYGKNYLTLQDFSQKNNKFLYAAYLSCLKSIRKDAYYPFYFELLKLKAESLVQKKYKISSQMLDECVQGNDKDMKTDILEIENFGISGISARFYIGINGTDNTILDGVPKYPKFNRTIRQYEFSVGN